jgi:hypothetical protein
MINLQKSYNIHINSIKRQIARRCKYDYIEVAEISNLRISNIEYAKVIGLSCITSNLIL